MRPRSDHEPGAGGRESLGGRRLVPQHLPDRSGGGAPFCTDGDPRERASCIGPAEARPAGLKPTPVIDHLDAVGRRNNDSFWHRGE